MHRTLKQKPRLRVLGFRATWAEHRLVRRAARLRGETVSSMLRRLALEAAEKVESAEAHAA